ncbi:MAG TPA: hypothetical protein VEJ16_07910 [Alphaproteobacteria bacterium]|nr:hypothetical protein [Alphaproteobacteria bacterium]
MDTSATTGRASRYLFDENLFRQINELGLSLRIEFDMEEWKTYILGTDWPVVNASADPARHEFKPGEVFWLNLHKRGHTIGTQVLRIIETEDYVELIRSHRLWYGDSPSALREARMLRSDLPRLGGTVVQASGLYIDPAWRRARTSWGMRLVAASMRLTHDFTLRNLHPDWAVTLIEKHVATPRIIHDLYGYPHAVEVFEAFFPYVERMERMTMAWMSHAELAGVSRSPPPAIGRSPHLFAPSAG